jgi:hypothetical protein
MVGMVPGISNGSNLTIEYVARFADESGVLPMILKHVSKLKQFIGLGRQMIHVSSRKTSVLKRARVGSQFRERSSNA